MKYSPKVLLYQAFIDPLLAPIRRNVLLQTDPGDMVLDVACGTGALALDLALRVKSVTGTDISEMNIAAAARSAKRRNIVNIIFIAGDASDLSGFISQKFNTAITSMSVHQFDADLAIRILTEMKRISEKVIIADYNHHMPGSWGRSLAWSIERMAGGEHFRNFRNYMECGGIHYFARKADLRIKSERITGGGIFVISVCE